MRHGVLVSLVLSLAAPAMAASQATAPSSTDYMFQCAATFLIASHDLQTADKPKSAAYKTQYERLTQSAEQSFARFQKPKSEVKTYMQQHVDAMSTLFSKDATALTNFIKMCEKRFPK